MNEKAVKGTFLKSAMILGIAGLVVQVLGAVFRIPLGNIIGDEGMGYYQTAYPLYIALLVFSTNGAPAAISKMTSERLALGRHGEAYRVFKLSFIVMAIFGISAFSLVFFSAGPLVSWLGDRGAFYAMRTIAPALIFVPILSVFRGYFQGMQDMMPTAISQLIDQGMRVIIGLSLAILLLPRGLEIAAAGATFGAAAGSFIAIFAILILYLRRKKAIMVDVEKDKSIDRESAGSILKTFAFITIPITIGVSIMPIMNLGDLLVVMRRLQDIGYTTAEANALYGQLSGMAIPVVNVPMALALSMALAMVPAIASAKASSDAEGLAKNIRLGFRTAVIIGIPCSFGLMALAEPIMRLLYPLQIESAINSADCLFILGISVTFLCIGQTMAGTLQGLGRAGLAVWGIVLGFVIKCISTFVLTGIPSLNVEGAAWGTVLGFVSIGIFNFIASVRVTKIKHDMVLSLIRPMVAGIIMFIVVKLSYIGMDILLNGSSIATLLAVGLGAAVYGVALLKSKAITIEEIETLPKGAKLARLLRKLHI